jgi:antitoxin component of MazEF toxin-antitoxin module
MKTLTKARVLGGSLVITIPRRIVEEENIKPDEFIEINIEKMKKSFFGVASKITPFTKKDELKGYE